MSNSKRSSLGGSDSIGSKKVPKSSEQSSPSASATASGGYRRVKDNIRSCLDLRSPLALPLIALLTDGDDGIKTFGECPLLEKYRSDKDKLAKAKDLGEEAFKKALKAWGGTSETEFTDTHLDENLKHALSAWNEIYGKLDVSPVSSQESLYVEVDSQPAKASKQVPVKGRNEDGVRSGKTDMLMWERDNERSIARPLCLMEVGLTPPYTSWEKIHQGLMYQYVEMMLNSERFRATKADGDLKQISFDRPMLLSSILMGKNGAHCEFGLFLCVPVAPSNGAEHGEFRVMLLWRKRVDNNLNEVSAAFGKVFQASIALQIWRKEMIWCDFEYLGPNCARVGDRLYRSYDTRFRQTDRPPNLYFLDDDANAGNEEYVGEEKKVGEEPTPMAGFHWYPSSPGEKPSENEATINIFAASYCDPQEASGFGSAPHSGDKKEWLWENKGRLLVISVPYRIGVHTAEILSDFVPLMKHLDHLHAHGKVHGDIRAFNMVFPQKQNEQGEKESKGWLIDLDFGGVAGKASYPNNFNYNLSDGFRLRSEAGSIQKMHDFYALCQVALRVHIPLGREEEDAFGVKAFGLTNKFINEKDFEADKKMLEDFLCEYGKVKLGLSHNFGVEIGKLDNQENRKLDYQVVPRETKKQQRTRT
ncbi:expressed unknown protein [Seminavis robusta]|uniref:Uncharacterized protein n=1 Tax=Seminavis robusta TaxID=568900 RepID=A0A9N8HWM3_9STRA|nr:expressed unknown protein [Seminavis robusta]|eukprot:Sro2003_g310370.1 n/a (645) ;mRNA; f:5153-7172